MMSEEDDKVRRLNVRFKVPPSADGPMLKVVDGWDRSTCNHRNYFEGSHPRSVQYLIRDGETEVECGQCGTKLDPMFVLRRLAVEETQWHNTRQRYQKEMKRLDERSRTKCQHCEKITRISRT